MLLGDLLLDIGQIVRGPSLLVGYENCRCCNCCDEKSFARHVTLIAAQSVPRNLKSPDARRYRSPNRLCGIKIRAAAARQTKIDRGGVFN